jgi:hypothetical protein
MEAITREAATVAPKLKWTDPGEKTIQDGIKIINELEGLTPERKDYYAKRIEGTHGSPPSANYVLDLARQEARAGVVAPPPGLGEAPAPPAAGEAYENLKGGIDERAKRQGTYLEGAALDKEVIGTLTRDYPTRQEFLDDIDALRFTAEGYELSPEVKKHILGLIDKDPGLSPWKAGEIKEWQGKPIKTIYEDRGVHVSSKPENVTKLLEEGGDIGKGRAEGLVGDLGTPGLYYSNAPQLWTGRATEKWLAFYDLPQGKRDALVDALTEKVNAQRESGYISAGEHEYAIRDLGHFKETGRPEFITKLAGQPYNIAFWKPEYLKEFGIEQEKPPAEIPLTIKGKLADITEVRTAELPELVQTLKDAGYDGMIHRGHWGMDPQSVVWNNNAIQRFGDYEAAAAAPTEAATSSAGIGRPYMESSAKLPPGTQAEPFQTSEVTPFGVRTPRKISPSNFQNELDRSLATGEPLLAPNINQVAGDVKILQGSDDISVLQMLARHEQKGLEDVLNGISRDLDGGGVSTRVKEGTRIEEKIAEKQRFKEYSAAHMTDWLGGRLAIKLNGHDPMGDIGKIKESLAQRGITAISGTEVDYVNHPTDWGYRAYHFLVKTPQGLVGEIQVHFPKGLELVTSSWNMYSKWRTIINDNGGSLPDNLHEKYLGEQAEWHKKWDTAWKNHQDEGAGREPWEKGWEDIEGKGTPGAVARIPGEGFEAFEGGKAILDESDDPQNPGFLIQREDGTHVLNRETNTALFETADDAKKAFYEQEKLWAGKGVPADEGIFDVKRVPVSEIKVAPEIFQFKQGYEEATGAGLALEDVRKWDEGLAGVLTLWRSPEGDQYVVNGHQRLALARRLGVKNIRAQILDSSRWDQKEARAYGAKINIAEGRGTEMDMAKFMRDTGLTPEDLANEGLSLSEAKTDRSVALSQVIDPIFHQTSLGRFPIEKAIIIGRELGDDKAAQEGIYKLLIDWDKKGKVISGERLKEIIRLTVNAPRMVGKQINLFGEEELASTLIMEKADILTHARRALLQDRGLFTLVSKRTARLREAGNVLDRETNKLISRESADALALLDKFAYLGDSTTSKVLNDYAVRLAESENKVAVKNEAYKALKNALSEDRARFFPGEGGYFGITEKEPEAGAVDRKRRTEVAGLPPSEIAPPGIQYSIEGAFGLKPAERPATRYEQRLGRLTDDFPTIDRDRASIILRSFPDATDEQVANMVADPEMYDRMVKGALTQADLDKMKPGPATQPALPGMEIPGRLFRLAGGEEGLVGGFRKADLDMIVEAGNRDPKFRDDFNRAADRAQTSEEAIRVLEEFIAKAYIAREPLSTELLKTRVGKRGTVEEIDPGSLFVHRWAIQEKGGLVIIVAEAKDGSLKLGVSEKIPPEYAALGITSFEGKTIAGAHELLPFNLGSFIEVARGEGIRTLDHELWHHIERFLLTEKELAKITEKYGDNPEVRAQAYAEWDPVKTPDTIFQKIKDFFTRIVKAITGYQSADDIFAKARSGELFGREPIERGLEAGRRFQVAGIRPDLIERAREKITQKVTTEKEEVQRRYQGAADWASSLLWPTRRSEEGRWTHQVIAGRQAERDAETKRMNRGLKEYIPLTRFDNPDTLAALRLYEGHQEGQITDPVFQGLFKNYRPEEQRQVNAIQALGIDLPALQDYVDHLWKPSAKLDEITRSINAELGRSIQGPKYFLNRRIIASIPAGIEAGLEPRYDSLAEMMMAGRAAHEHFIGAQRAIADVKGAGKLQIVRSKDQIPEGWRILPGAYGEVWTRVDRRGGQMIPERADEEVLPLGGGPERAGYEDVPGVKGWMRVGYRVAPDEVVRQFENFVSRGWEGNDAFQVYQNALFGVRHLQMALSAWHLTFEGINAMASRAWMGLSDTIGGIFGGDFRRGARGVGELFTAPFALPIYIRKGLEMDKALMNPKYADPDFVQVSRILVAGGVHPAAETRIRSLLKDHLVQAGRNFQNLNIFQGTGDLLKTASSGLMDFIVPQGKNGQTMIEYLHEVERFKRQTGRDPTRDEKIRLAYEVREHAENVWGAVARDNVNVSAAMRSLFSFWLQFPRFNIGSAKLVARDIKGISTVARQAIDFLRGRPVEKMPIEARIAMQYTVGLLFSVGLMGGLMHYAFTGRKPNQMKDFYFPSTGETLPNGAEERLQLPSYLKDALGLVKHPARTVTAKEATFLHILNDLIENKDYWGEQIVDPYASPGEKLAGGLQYLGRQVTPFVAQTYMRGQKQTPGRAALSFLGVRPVTREFSNTPALQIIDQYNEMMRGQMTTREGAEVKRMKADLMKLARSGDEQGFMNLAEPAIEAGKLTRQQVKDIVKDSQEPAGVSRFRKMPLEWKLRAFNVATPFEQQQWLPGLLKSLRTEKPEHIIGNREALIKTFRQLGMEESADLVRDLRIPGDREMPELEGFGERREPPEIPEDVDTMMAQLITRSFEKLEQPELAKERSLFPRPQPKGLPTMHRMMFGKPPE